MCNILNFLLVVIHFWMSPWGSLLPDPLPTPMIFLERDELFDQHIHVSFSLWRKIFFIYDCRYCVDSNCPTLICMFLNIFSHHLNFVWILGELLKFALHVTDWFSSMSIMFFTASNVVLYSVIAFLIFLKPFYMTCITFNIILMTFHLSHLSLRMFSFCLMEARSFSI